jgi:hypothetical protein
MKCSYTPSIRLRNVVLRNYNDRRRQTVHKVCGLYLWARRQVCTHTLMSSHWGIQFSVYMRTVCPKSWHSVRTKSSCVYVYSWVLHNKPMCLREHFNQGCMCDLKGVVLFTVNFFKGAVPNVLHKISRHAVPVSNPTLILEDHFFSTAQDCFKGRVYDKLLWTW